MIERDDVQNFQSLPTPFYFYDLQRLDRLIQRAQSSAARYGYHIHYAMKANADDRILKSMKDAGLGIDCVSGAEVSKALSLGFDPSVIAFAGVGKSDHEIELAMDANIFSLNVESIEELRVIELIAQRRGVRANVALRLNPDVDAKTHHYITTGLEENKFGISGWQIDEVIAFLRSAKHIDLKGLHFHIGSQIQDLEPFRNLCGRITMAIDRFEDAGFPIEHINAGGGLGVNYDTPDAEDDPDFEVFFGIFNDLLALRSNQNLHFELGRSLVAHCGDLISRVLYVKKGVKTNFLILDAGMTELIRPALYQAIHKVENLTNANGQKNERYDVVGPVCESSDCFGKSVVMPLSKRGDLIAIRTAGAYGEAMASHYNLRSLNPTVYK